MNGTYRNLFVIAVLLLTAGSGFAGLTSPRPLLDLEQRADLIVVASASGTYQPGSAVSFLLNVVRVVKGDSSLVGSAIPVSWTSDNQGLAIGPARVTVKATGSGLWFLQNSSNGWQLLPVLQGTVTLDESFFPEPSSVPILNVYAYSPTAPVSEKIAAELSFAIESAGTQHTPQLSLLQYHLLDDLNSPFIKTLYQRLSESAGVQKQMLGLSGLIRIGSATALNAATQNESAFQPYALENGILLQSIRDRFRSTDANSVIALGGATSTSYGSQDFRKAAAHALAAIHTASSMPYLAALLDDPDPDLRVEAVGGIGAFANGLPVQTAASLASMSYLQPSSNAPYRTADTVAHFAMGTRAIEKDEASYVAFWKSWWDQNRARLGF